jgi:hypothetical protein
LKDINNKIYYVYLTTNNLNGKQYVGDRCTCNVEKDNNYIGSGVYLRESIKKYGKKNFSKIILEKFSNRIDSYKAQEKYIKMYNTLKPFGYNISPKGGCNESNSVSEETKNKIRIKNIGKFVSEETRRKIGESSSNRSAESNYRCGSANRGKETWMKGKCHTEESNELNRQKHLGIKHSDETNRKKARPGDKNGMFGRTFYQIWVEKYGKEEADVKYENWKQQFRGKKKSKKNNN